MLEYDIASIIDPFLHNTLLRLLCILCQGDANPSNVMNFQFEKCFYIKWDKFCVVVVMSIIKIQNALDILARWCL